MVKLKSLFLSLNAANLLVVIFSLFLTLLNLIFIDRVDNWLNHVSLNFLLIIFVISLSYFYKHNPNIFLKQVHYWYLVPLIFLFFKELYFMIYPIRGIDYDTILIEIDRFIFGFDPTIELFRIANPYLTELLQIVYGTFFFLPIILGINLMLNDRGKELDFEAFIIVYGFILSYIGYLLVPAVGPRFTLHDFDATNAELPGLFLTNFLRNIVNAGESIPVGTLNPGELVQRDVFPSGHTQMTLMVMYLSVKFNVKTKYFFLPVGTLLIFSTVYLRYHYVIDLLAGGIFMIFALWSGYYLYNYWLKIKGEESFKYRKN